MERPKKYGKENQTKKTDTARKKRGKKLHSKEGKRKRDTGKTEMRKRQQGRGEEERYVYTARKGRRSEMQQGRREEGRYSVEGERKRDNNLPAHLRMCGGSITLSP